MKLVMVLAFCLECCLCFLPTLKNAIRGLDPWPDSQKRERNSGLHHNMIEDKHLQPKKLKMNRADEASGLGGGETPQEQREVCHSGARLLRPQSWRDARVDSVCGSD